MHTLKQMTVTTICGTVINTSIICIQEDNIVLPSIQFLCVLYAEILDECPLNLGISPLADGNLFSGGKIKEPPVDCPGVLQVYAVAFVTLNELRTGQLREGLKLLVDLINPLNGMDQNLSPVAFHV